VHNGYFFVNELMKHYQRTEINNPDGDMNFELVQLTDIRTDPKLEADQIDSIKTELERMFDLYDKLMARNPL
jgi:hypothetical protein